MNVYRIIRELVGCTISSRLIEQEDEIYVRNQILSLLHIHNFVDADKREWGISAQRIPDIPDLVEELVAYACEQGVIENVFDEKEILSSKIMNCFMPLPSTLNQRFYRLNEQSPTEATDFFYDISKNSNYIHTKRIQKNISYKAETVYGPLDITINLSKPEKDPKEIAQARKVVSAHYPKCLLCIENEGYAGRSGHPARSNHRLIRLELAGEPWYLQYSPYLYYNEHCIVLSEEHRDMKIDRSTFLRLLAFVEQFPHYFAGSNADLPIVGGSILSHDHYQGGNYEFAMAVADEEYPFQLNGFPDLQCAIVKWPMTIIRLRSKNTTTLVDAGDYILGQWRNYSDQSVGIYAYTSETPHNTITPIARKRNGGFELDLVLRNNRVNAEHPLGIFHPHEDVQHIKKENIGLIEVMGLAILPARLNQELQEIANHLLGKENVIADYHKPWAEQLKETYKNQINDKNVQEIIKKETAAKFLRVLEDAGVFKRDEQGIFAFRRFIQALNESCK
jgi:UDPglucose--hexose-1-phosphate uridylyltransferase